jgi:hypothetical protein
MKCYYPQWKESPEVEESEITLTKSLMGSDNADIDELIRTDISINKKKPSLIESVGGEVVEYKSCIEHYNVNAWSFQTRVALYSCLMLIGITNFGLQIKLIVDSLEH